jgi:hypothetical protein
VKKLTTIPIALGSFLFLAFPLFAAQTDFSGTWVLDQSGSSIKQSGQPNKKTAGAAAQKKLDLSKVDQRLVIKQTATDLVVENGVSRKGKAGKGSQTFRLDGSESTNQTAGKRGQVKARANWDGGILLIKGTEKISSKKGETNANHEQKWSLSEDGRILTIVTVRSMQHGRNLTSTLVYKKQ